MIPSNLMILAKELKNSFMLLRINKLNTINEKQQKYTIQVY